MKWIILLWSVLAMAAAAALSAGWGPAWSAPDWAHIVGHLVLFGGMAWVVERRLRWRPLTTLIVVLAAGVGVELAQVAGGGHRSMRELGFDVMVDALAAMVGLALGCRQVTARALGLWLHPALVVPIGLCGTFYAALREVPAALVWTTLAVACWLPAAGVWLGGIRLGWFSGLDLVECRERVRLFALACGCAGLFVALTHGLGAPASVLEVAHQMLLTSLAVTAATMAGFKLSGHVTVALLLAVAIAPWSVRGPVLLVTTAILLSWGRVRTHCHRPIEIAGAWVVAGLPLLLGISMTR
ncbi:MAG: hypothetical protein JW751_03485 [Polyangiaceae bacterium]|nr:hypothetical protein [Polyangiaceae bacterium]